jgi:hypothetical protein
MVSLKRFLLPVGFSLFIIGIGVIFMQAKNIKQLQRKYQHVSEHVFTLNRHISWMQQQAEMVADTMLRHKDKLLQAEEKTDAIRKKLRQIQTNDYCAGQPVPDDVIRLQYEASRIDKLPVSADPLQPTDPHPDSGTGDTKMG